MKNEKSKRKGYVVFIFLRFCAHSAHKDIINWMKRTIGALRESLNFKLKTFRKGMGKS